MVMNTTRRCNMNKERLKETIHSLSQDGEKRKELIEILREHIKGMVKEVLEEVALIEREVYCEENDDTGNGFYERSLRGLNGEIELRVPRTRRGGFRPFFIERYKRTSYELEEIVVAMYAGGCSTRDISNTISNLIEGKYSASWVSRVTDAIKDKVEEFRKRAIEKWFPFLFIDGVVLKIRRGNVEGEVVYVALGIDEDGHREVLGFWLFGAEGESAIIWEEILRELCERGLSEPLCVIGDNLPGLADAVKKVFPKADFQVCLLHKMRNTLNKVRRRDREAVGEDLKRICSQPTKEAFEDEVRRFQREWGQRYPGIGKSWLEDINNLTSFLKYPQEIRAYIYTTNHLERFMKEVRRRAKVIEIFPQEDAASKILYIVSKEMNERYSRKVLRYFEAVKEKLLEIRRMRYGYG
jgi:transposase-like protein